MTSSIASIIKGAWSIDRIERIDAKAFTPLAAVAPAPVAYKYPEATVVNIEGMLVRSEEDATFLRYFTPATSYESLSNTITEAREDSDNIILRINSPGGQVAGLSCFCAFLHDANIIACEIVDQATSAAYFIAASAACHIIASSDEAIVGGMGVRMIANSEGIEIVDTYSPAKSAQTDEGKDARIAMATDMADALYNIASAGRGVDLRQHRGAIYTARQATHTPPNLIDGIGTITFAGAGNG